ncbi:hypothetical protein ACFLVE_04455 [Chloroflexota bacterium]
MSNKKKSPKPPVKNLKTPVPLPESLPEKAPTPEEPQPQETPPAEASTGQPETPSEPVTSTTEPAETPTPVLTLESLHRELESLKLTVAELQATLARKRKPVASNGKVQILDKQTGEIYPSKNNAYQTLLKSGELKELVDKRLFGDIPAKNTFGWYTLVREWPERFEEAPQEKQA